MYVIALYSNNYRQPELLAGYAGRMGVVGLEDAFIFYSVEAATEWQNVSVINLKWAIVKVA